MALSRILGTVSVNGDAAGHFVVDFGFEPDCNAHTNLNE